MIKGIFFDLDDTLYNARDYWKLAFFNISNFLAVQYGIPKDEIRETLWNALRNKGSLYPRLFNDVLACYGLNSSACIGKVVDLFHYAPIDGSITLYKDVKIVLPRLALKYKLGLITNGHPEMQRRKVKALGLNRLFHLFVYTAEFGAPKPSQFGYRLAATIANVNPKECIYVGDNPLIDFTGAKQVGMYTVRLLRGEFAEIRANNELIDKEVEDFYELEQLLSEEIQT